MPVATSLLLFFFGVGVLLIFGVIAAQDLIGGDKGFPLRWSLVSVVWGIGAVLLGLLTRREASRFLRTTALIWWFPFWLIVIEGGRLGLFDGLR